MTYHAPQPPFYKLQNRPGVVAQTRANTLSRGTLPARPWLRQGISVGGAQGNLNLWTRPMF